MAPGFGAVGPSASANALQLLALYPPVAATANGIVGATIVLPSRRAASTARFVASTLCTPIVAWGPRISVPPVGRKTEVQPFLILSATSVCVRSSSSTTLSTFIPATPVPAAICARRTGARPAITAAATTQNERRFLIHPPAQPETSGSSVNLCQCAVEINRRRDAGEGHGKLQTSNFVL